MFWLFPENGSISERSVNRALIVHEYNPIKFCINKKKILIFIFAMYQNYPLALTNQILHKSLNQTLYKFLGKATFI